MGEMKARLIGLVMIAAGGALAWYFGFKPLEEARAGAQEVSYSVKMFLVAPMAIVFGLFLAIGGVRVADVVMAPPRTARQHLIVWPLFVLALAVGGLAWWWLDGQLSALGYR